MLLNGPFGSGLTLRAVTNHEDHLNVSTTITRFQFRKPEFLAGQWGNMLRPVKLLCCHCRIPLTNITYEAFIADGPHANEAGDGKAWLWFQKSADERFGGWRVRVGRLHIDLDFLPASERTAATEADPHDTKEDRLALGGL
ncbi:hypothetical protein [Acidocella sp. MX-AZ02]|uniref:hypothetical protein n=1 Tax=Acidocella sp. MX-AZ02 TaxID=1214225 RepID=UPI00028CAEA8|nr:hypothetical protein [Acidocella sp. MX-AZ02]EKN00828.1 hypothetical protein MXAZACID_03429 [Acidocella sp. MX-AZ02]